jgi:Holliday junction resolvase-like predicted endonuclease
MGLILGVAGRMLFGTEKGNMLAPLLDENDVVDAVCAHLESQGYGLVQRCTTNDRGIDIIAKHPAHSGNLMVEAKGAKSSKPGSPRYGQNYRKPEVFDRVAKGFYTAASMHANRQNGDQVALAYPDTDLFQEYLLPIKPVVKQLGIQIFMVREDRSVYML